LVFQDTASKQLNQTKDKETTSGLLLPGGENRQRQNNSKWENYCHFFTPYIFIGSNKSAGWGPDCNIFVIYSLWSALRKELQSFPLYGAFFFGSLATIVMAEGGLAEI
jgi:hypothetical protein